jgi:hypothetical protein
MTKDDGCNESAAKWTGRVGTSEAGRVIAVFVMLIGIGFLTMVIGAVSRRFITPDLAGLSAADQGTFTCDIYFGSFGSLAKFSVLRAADGSGFSAYLNGNYFAGPWTLGFPSDGVAYASAEYNGSPAPTGYDFTWGPTSGNTPWQSSVNAGGSWQTITSAAPYNDGGWTVGQVPSPFHITR